MKLAEVRQQLKQGNKRFGAVVSGRRTVVRLEREYVKRNGRSAWHAVNEETGRTVMIGSAARLTKLNPPSHRPIETL